MGKFAQQLKLQRMALRESQAAFGARFGVSHAAVSEWEAGKSDMPNKVIEFLLEDILSGPTYAEKRCPTCEGMGVIYVAGEANHGA